MSEYIRHHYIPQFILKNFTNNNSVYLFNHIDFKLYNLPTRDVFMVENLYDYDKYNDIKVIEKELASKIESPMGRIVKKFLKVTEDISSDQKPRLILSRKELLHIKKYLMLQFYRTEGNMSYYLDENVGDINETSKYNILENETKIDFWKREMKYILDNDWESLLKSEMLGVRRFADKLNKGYLGFFVADQEFIISDIGQVAERKHFSLSKDAMTEAIDFIKKHPDLLPYPDVETILRKEYEKQSSYIDNFYYFPISPKVAIVSFESIWQMKLAGLPVPNYLSSYLPINRYEPPSQDYVNADKIKQDKSNLYLYKDDEDKFYYIIQYLSENETTYLNTLMMNEAMKSIVFKTPPKIVGAVKRYMHDYHAGIPNVKRNYSGLIRLLKNQNLI